MFFLYNEIGAVTQSVSAADADSYRAFLAERGEAFIEAGNPPADSIADLAVVDGELVAREPMGATISALVAAVGEAVTLAGLPSGASVTIHGPHQDSFTTSGPSEVLAFDVPGSYWLHVFRFPFRDAHFQVEVTA